MDKFSVLKEYFGYDSFRKGQEKLIDAILSGQDVLGIMPTGAGKSLCYQIPALLLPGITLVVSPLISLMKDQVQALNQVGVHAAYINSSLNDRQITKALQLAAAGQYKIIYVAPERLETWEFMQFARQVMISMITVDEAHCISQWGQDFRPSYLKIVQFIKIFAKRPVISAFTATATQTVKKDIVQVLNLKNPQVLVTGFDRENLYFSVKTPRHKEDYVLWYVENHEQDSGVIYCATRKNVDKVCEKLQHAGIEATRYHAGLSAQERKQNQDDFIYDRKSVMVATNAFGMGIDKSNVRYVIHFNMPQSLENYYQEAGRAGRDGEDAECILLYSGQDVMINRYLFQNKEENPELSVQEVEEIRKRDEDRLRTMTWYCKTKKCLREYILHYFGESSSPECGNCSNCVAEVDSYAEKETSYERGRGRRRDERDTWRSDSRMERWDGESYTSAGDWEDDLPFGKKKSAKKKSKAAGLDENGQALFEELRSLRKAIAARTAIPPYLIFSDKTLLDMCVRRPQNEEDMLTVSGVGEYKYEKYGREFLNCVLDFGE